MKTAWRIKKRYPGMDKNLNIGDIIVQRDNEIKFCYKISENTDWFFETHTYTTVDMEEGEFFEKLILKIEYE